MKKLNQQIVTQLKEWTSLLAIIVAAIVAHVVYYQIFGHASHFVDGLNTNEPLQGDYFGIVYKGGFIVPILMSLFLITFIFTIERMIVITKADGKIANKTFLINITPLLAASKLDEALLYCESHKGTLGSVVHSAISKFKKIVFENEISKSEKLASVQKEIEDATELELSTLEKNLPIISTIVSIATLIALLGTVLGMIKAFAGMAADGAPDAAALATGISEALINTSLGIGTSAIAIVSYNYFSNRVDKVTKAINEASMVLHGVFSSPKLLK
jgi:biopolymer transport protein ExbB